MRDSSIKQILVVDDEDLYRAMLQKFLAKNGYACATAGSSADALRALQQQEFDVVISDIIMEEVDGLQMMQQAKAQWPQIDFIIMTGYAERYSYCNIVDAGASDFISKPFDLGELKAKLDRIERERKILRKLEETNEALQWEARANAALAELSRVLLASASMDDISRLVLEDARNLTNSPLARAAYIDRTTERMVCLSLDGTVLEAMEKPIREDTPGEEIDLWGWIPMPPKTLLGKDLPAEGSSADDVGPVSPQPAQVLSVPAFAGEDLIGRLAVAAAERDYTERDQELLERMGTIYALSIQRKWSEDQLRKAHDRLEELVQERSAKLARAGELLRQSMKSLEQLRTDADQT